MYITFPVESYLTALRDPTGTTRDEATIISVAELLCLLSLAAVQYRSWDGRVVLYVTDNDNVRVWLIVPAMPGTEWPGTFFAFPGIWK